MPRMVPLLGAAVVFLIVGALGFGLGAQCADAWRSLSIGAAGACSSHGGVVRDPWPVVVLAAALPAAGAWLALRAVAARDP